LLYYFGEYVSVCFMMRSRFVKVLGLAWLSVLLAYSGAAWAIGNCLKDSSGRGPRQTISGVLDDRNPTLVSVPLVTEGSVDVLHCPSNDHEIRGIVQPTIMASFTSPRKGTKVPLSHTPTASRERGTAKPHWDLEWSTSSAPPSVRSRHLFLSVFLI
jgi:hypothetical protein